MARALLSSVVVLLILAPAAHAQGGAPAPDFSEPCPALYPGDGAGRALIARWMARGAAGRGLPHELPVMAGIAESGLRNIRGGTYHGFFGMHESLNAGEYRGYPRNPELQLRWFLDTAAFVRQRRVAEGRPDPAADPGAFGIWIADVERPAPENRGGYQRHLAEAQALVDGRCAPPERADTTPPRLFTRIAARQAPLAAGGIAVRVRCPDHDCLVGATATVGPYTIRTAAIAPTRHGRLVIRLSRPARRLLVREQKLDARVRVIAADAAANATIRERSVLLGS